jgi:hypothetical protein
MNRIRQDLQFSRIFKFDFLAAMALAAATLYLVSVVRLPKNAVTDMTFLAASFIALQLIKIVITQGPCAIAPAMIQELDESR